jgi:hypothetical protein
LALKQYREQIVGRRALTLTDANQSARMGEIQHLFAGALVGTEPAKMISLKLRDYSSKRAASDSEFSVVI